MNGRIAKKLRKATYRDMSLRNPRRYTRDQGGTIRLHYSDPRSSYKMEKEDYYQERRKHE